MSRSGNSLHASLILAANHLRINVAIAVCLLTLAGVCVPTVQSAEISSESPTQLQTMLSVMLHESGIARLYEDLLEIVLTETRLARQTCNDTPANAFKIQRFISQTLDVNLMMEDSVEQLSRALEQSMIDKIADWKTSDSARLIQKAEAQSVDWSEEEFAQRKLTLANNSDWNDERRKLITRVLVADATVPFVTALHSETSALVLQAGDCVASDTSRASIKHRIQQARNDESFYSVFLRNDIHTTAAIIFNDISDADLDAYVKHSQSAEGRAWNEALLNMIRQVLRNRHAAVNRLLVDITNN